MLRTAITHATRCMSTSAGPISSVTVLGAGTMGAGIAQVSAVAGHKVILVDVNDGALQKGMDAMKNSLTRMTKKKFASDPEAGTRFVDKAMANVSTSTALTDAVADTDLVIEAIVENIEVKRNVWKSIDDAADARTIFASNTSSLPIREMAEVTGRADKFGGLHYFSPVPMMKLCEVVRSDHTSDETIARLTAFAEEQGKTTVACKDTPGFIVNRLLVPYMAEAVRMHERGDASTKDIDTAMRLGCGYPMGPFELMDMTGVDVCAFILRGWAEKYPDEPLFKPTETLEKMVSEGRLGRKTGHGLYKY
jgi:3-hydroxyacyl-CoA dehydrogenase